MLRASLEASLRRLRTDHIDLYYVHVDDRATPLEETLETLASFVTAGTVRHIGWSNVRTWRLERIRRLAEQHGWPAPVALQQEYSYLHRRPGLRHGSIVDDEQLDYLEEHPDLTLVAYSPALKGLYDQTPEQRADNWLLESYRGEVADRQLEVVEQVAAELGVLPSQVVLAWLAQHRPTVVPIVGSARPERIDQAAAALDLTLSADQLARLAAV